MEISGMLPGFSKKEGALLIVRVFLGCCGIFESAGKELAHF